MKNGRLYDAGTLNETYPRKKALETQWWWKVEPPTQKGLLVRLRTPPGVEVLDRRASRP